MHAALLTSVALTTAPALAQTADAIRLDEVTVTGEKIERTLQQTGSSVAVVRDADLTREKVLDAFEVFQRIPNVQVANDQRDVVIRGVPKQGLATNEDILTQSPNDVVTTFLDGVPVSTWAGPTSTWDIGQIEVFRGPQTTTSGRGSLGGAVFFRTLDPTPEWTSRARALFGSFDTTAFSGSISGPIVPGAVGMRLSIDRQSSDGFIRNVTAGVPQDIDRHTTARAKFVYDQNEGTRIDLSFTHSDRLRGGGLASLDAFPRSFIAVTNIPERVDKVVDVMSLAFRQDLAPGWRLEGLTALGSEDAKRSLDADVTALDLVRARVNETVLQAGQELRVVYDEPGAWMRGFIGVYGRAFERQAVNDISGLLNIRTDNRTRTTTFAVFGESTFDVTPQLHLTTGGRLESDSFKTRFLVQGGSASDESLVPLPKVALGYDWTPDVTTIGTVQRAYRAGGAGQSLLSATTYTFAPEYTWNYEAALRTRWLDGRLFVNLNAFHVDWDKQQVTSLIGGNPFDATIVNAGRSELEGVEAEARYRLTDQLTVFASAGYLRTRFIEFVNAGQNLAGNQFPFASPYQVGTGFSWTDPSGVSFALDANFLGPSFSDIQNAPVNKNQGRILVNAVTSYRWDNLVASFFVKNLFDERYSFVKAASVGIVGPGTPRLIGGEIRVEF